MLTAAIPNQCICNGKRLIGDLSGGYAWCICARQELNDEWPTRCIQNCNIPAWLLEQQNFETWIPSMNVGCNEASRLARQHAEGRASAKWLFLEGQSGLGKTHLLMAATGTLAARGVEVVYYTATELQRALREAIDVNQASQLVKSLSTVRALVLDDLGTQYDTPWIRTEIHAILDKRYINRAITLLSTNVPLSQFEFRLRSRLTDALLVDSVELTGADARPRLGG